MQYNNEKISIIMPAYNSEKFITESVKSALNQTYENIELIICDDASLDDTVKVAVKMANSDIRVNVIEKTANSGVSDTRNIALKQANGRYIAFLDSDDIWKPEKLKKQINFMKKTECAVCYSSYRFIDVNGKQLNNKSAKIKTKADYRALLKDNFIGMLTVLIDRNKTGDISFSNKRHEDLILWLKLTKENHSILALNEVLANYRVSAESLSGNKKRAAAWRWDVYRKSEKINIFSSIWYMMFYIINAFKKRL